MPKYLDRDGARAFILEQGVKIGDNALKDHAARETGPHYRIINGRACYTREDLLAWIEEQAARPLRKRGRRQATQPSA